MIECPKPEHLQTPTILRDKTMAKKTESMFVATEHKIEEFAEDLSKLLGQARSKAEGWMGQRATFIKHLEDIRKGAADLLTQLGPQGLQETQPAHKRRGRPAASATGKRAGRPAAGAKKKRTMSAEARARISAAQTARWAARRAAGKKK